MDFLMIHKRQHPNWYTHIDVDVDVDVEVDVDVDADKDVDADVDLDVEFHSVFIICVEVCFVLLEI